METSSMQSFIWRLMLVFFISVPNSRFIATGIETSNTKTSSSHPRSSATATTTAFATSSLEKSIHNKSILMTQSDVQTTFPITLFARTIVGSSILTTESTAYAVERKVSDVDSSGVTTDSLYPSMTENSTANAFAEVAATTAAIQATFTTTAVTTAAQVTKATEWGTDTKNDGSNKDVQKMSSNGTYEASSNSSTKAKPSGRVREQQGGQESISREVAFGTSKQYVRQVYQEVPATTGTSLAANNNRVDDKHQLGGSNEAVDATTTLSTPTAAHSSLNDDSSRGSSKNMPTTPAEAMLASSSSATTPKAGATAMTSTTTAPTTTTTMKPWLPPPVDGYQTIISQAGTHAYLPCNVKQLVRKPISWLRVRDGHILTVDQTTFIADQRFQSVYSPNPERWSLQIKYVQTKDAGTYECQLSTEPKTSAIVTLLIVEPKTELIGESTRHVKVGSQVKLRCIITQALEPPLFINWFHNQKQIYLHNRRDWRTEMERIELTTEIPAAVTATAPVHASESITASAAKPNHRPKDGTATSPSSLLPMMQSSVALLSTGRDRTLATATTAARSTTTTTRVQRGPLQRTSTVATDVKQITTASLIIPSVEKQDSGNYTCSPSNSAPMTVVLHVLSGEYSASAITSGMSRIGQKDSLWFQAATVLTLLWILLLLQQLNFSGEKRTVKTSKGANIRISHLYRLVTTTTTKLTTTRIVLEVFEEKT